MDYIVTTRKDELSLHPLYECDSLYDAIAYVLANPSPEHDNEIKLYQDETELINAHYLFLISELAIRFLYFRG